MGERVPFGVGLVGYGLAGRFFHAPFIEAVDGLELRAIATSDPRRSAQAEREHQGARVVGGVDQILGRADIQLVVVATPNRLHARIASDALTAGHHVVVDKPLAMHVPEGAALIELAAASARLLTVFQNRRWDGDFLTVRRLVDDGALGGIDSFESRFEQWVPVADEWRESAAEAGGPLRDVGAHLVDQCLLLFGPVQRVWAQSDRRRPTSQVDDSVFVALDHAGGVRSRLWMSRVASKAGPRLRVRGLGGEYLKQDLDVQEGQLVGGMRPGADGFGEDAPGAWGHLHSGDGSVTPIATEPGRYVRFYELLEAAIRDDGPAPVDPADSLQVLRVLEAAERAARTGTAQAIPDA